LFAERALFSGRQAGIVAVMVVGVWFSYLLEKNLGFVDRLFYIHWPEPTCLVLSRQSPISALRLVVVDCTAWCEDSGWWGILLVLVLGAERPVHGMETAVHKMAMEWMAGWREEWCLIWFDLI
jgi:hypothetical protein